MAVCNQPGCPNIVPGRYCARHTPTTTQRGLGGAHRAARLRVLARDGYRCHWCGAYADTADHLTPRVHGGTSTDANLVAACRSCNSSRNARSA